MVFSQCALKSTVLFCNKFKIRKRGVVFGDEKNLEWMQYQLHEPEGEKRLHCPFSVAPVTKAAVRSGKT